MRICIYGAGAIGGFLGAKLAQSGADVTLIARGPHLAAMRANGLRLIGEGEEFVTRPAATDSPTDAGPQDAVIVTVKACGVAAIAEAMQPLIGPETVIVTAMNGIPHWYFHAFGGEHDGARVAAVDPDGLLWAKLPPERCIGCVVYPAGEIVSPGVVQVTHGNRFMLGEPDGSRSPRVGALSKALTDAGFKAPVRTRIRDDIWVKLWGNLSFNPVSALTHATLEDIAGDPAVRAVIRAMMVEGQAVAEALGVKFPVDVDTRIGWAADVGAHRTSMLQDLTNGKPMEIDALVTAVQELGRRIAVPTPTLDMVLALVQQRARVAGCY
ncbi:MAG: 2-dehydropantoate 2-reductase [Alphaproteobacteria bacterium]